MKIIFLGILISIFVVQVITESCQESRELESSCGIYCFKVVRPLLDHTRFLKSQIDELKNKNNSISKLEISERLIEEKFQQQDRKIEQKLESLRSTENAVQKQLEVLGKKMEDLRQKMDATKQSVGKPFEKIGSKYYYIEQSQKLNWFEAVHKCVSFGAHLVSIKNLSEFNGIVAKLHPNKSYWIDINDLGTEGEFLSLTTGLRATYYNWHSNNPDNYRRNEHCGDLWFHSNKHLMNDNSCQNKSYFICEHEDK